MLAMLAAIPAAALPDNLTFENFFGSMTFDRPIHFLEFPGRDSTWIVVENAGRVVLVQRQGGGWAKSTFDSLAVSGANAAGTPRDGGLLGFAFHPKYDSTGKFYAFYVGDGAPGAIFLVEGTADATRLKATSQPKRRLLRLQKTLDYHNGGTMYFGTDGYLYASVGDGGFVGGNDGDPENRAQNMATVFGKMIRIDVEGPDAFPSDTTRNYAYPADNPFVGVSGALPEIWASGLRSPWRWSFHPLTGEIWLGDVGQWDWEEVTVITKGGNAGWRVKEGPECFFRLATCDTTGLLEPVLSIPHPAGGQSQAPPAGTPATWRSNSVSGGVFYFGDSTSPFYGTYFWGDEVVSARIFAVKFEGNTPVDTLVAATGFPRSVGFATDSRGRIFAISRGGSNLLNTGTIRLVESPDMPYPEMPVAIREKVAGRRAGPISMAELRHNPSAYRIFGLDGRELRAIPSGAFLVQDRARPGAPVLMTGVR